MNHCDPLIGSGWIAVDLDGTLAHTDGNHDPYTIGAPIAPMVLRVKSWLADQRKVCIFTARLGPADDGRDYDMIHGNIQLWCMGHLGTMLPITCLKQKGIRAFYDDRAYRIGRNTGAHVEREANDLLRSAFSVAERQGAGTNWPAFEKRVLEYLEKHNPYRDDLL